MKNINLILAGFGNIGQAFYRLIHEKKVLCREKYGLDLDFTGILELGGGLLSPNESEWINLSATPISELPRHPQWKSALQIEDVIKVIKPGVVVECTPSNLKTGEPGLSHITKALEAGWHVVTANKGPLVSDFKCLKQKAQQNRVALKFSGATAAALPALDVGLYCLAGTEVLRIEGILNGTSNFILTRMRDGMSYKTALTEAQAKGIAERDPSLDVEGWDTAAKILLIANSVMGLEISLRDISVEGITRIAPGLFEQAKKEKKAIKLMGKVSKEEGKFQAGVSPLLLDTSHPLFGVEGTNKGITFFTDTMGTVTVTGGKSDPRGAAASLLKDTINIFRL